MPALFSEWSNALLRVTIALGLLGFAGAVMVLLVRANSVGDLPRDPVVQPMWFDHRHHVAGYGIDCLYCHASADRAAAAGMPATAVCMPCHNEVWQNSQYFAPVRESLATDRPIPWRRVNDLPDFVFFHHGIHTQKGVGCETCHGRVDRMALVQQTAPLTMAWCLDCHRQPERYLRPAEEATTMGWEADTFPYARGRALKRRYHVIEATTCTACHR